MGVSNQQPQPVPADVVAAVSGRPVSGEWEAILPLLTVDDNGYPHVCLLSRAEVAADRQHVYAVIASPTTIANLQRCGRATLVVFGDTAATYTKLVVNSAQTSGRWLLVAFDVTTVKRDSIDIPLRPPTCRVNDDVAARENWARSAALLAAATMPDD